MTREEAIAAGVQVNETQHSMKRRSHWHDYNCKGTYMLTLVVRERASLLGTLKGCPSSSTATVPSVSAVSVPSVSVASIATVPSASPVATVPSASPEGKQPTAHIELSPLGTAILREELAKISALYPQVEVWKVCIMPDHIHMIVRVKETLQNGHHLGMVVRGFKTGCSRAWWRLTSLPSGNAEGTIATTATVSSASPVATVLSASIATVSSASPVATVSSASPVATVPSASVATVPSASPIATVPSASPVATVPSASPVATVPSASPEGLRLPAPNSNQRPVLFEPGYNDKILLHEGQLDNWKHYLDDNPRRLMMKRQNPELFTVLTGMDVVGEQCQVVGNRFLLDIPDKMAVIVHRRYTDEENSRLREEWLACGERGGVLVSAAISPKEKEVLREAMNRGYNIILLRENGFPKLYKPSGEAFDACVSGFLLQISPWEFHMERKVITRAQCLHLNAMAERIAGKE